MSILTLSGSPSATSKSHRVLHQLADQLSSLGLEVDTLDVRELPAEALIRADYTHPAIQRALDQVARATALVIATPIYKAAYSGVLKTFLDLLPQDGLNGKIILPLATGGSLAHALALDYTLKPVLASLGARHLLASIHIVDHQILVANEHLTLDAEAQARLDEGLSSLIRAVAS
ncbi:FMN reductase [Azomonas agilis]|uniref:FMN reductase n=1 Tax=Azomonas agilis TaxID=116849 RepID=A0A562J0B4_9GAMM|nr:NADPH-dependent FMN reductase [Azomonas agilis]TWH76563.1 FMN reductase [Azomonas agilis]